MIQLKNVNKNFKNRPVLENFSLQVDKGEFVAICGPSGAGKTTILNLIGLLIQPDQGEISLCGFENPTERQIQKIRRETLGYIFQNYVLMENETVLENLEISKKYNSDWNIEKVKEILAEIALDESFLSKKVFELSGGEQQRIAIARVMLKRCELILADEPTGNLDTENKRIVINLFKKLKSMGKTIVCVTHDDEMAQAADRIFDIK